MKIELGLDKLLTLPNRIIGAISLFAACVLFSPDAWIEALYLTTLRREWGSIVGGVFVLSTAILAVQFFLFVLTVVRRKRAWKLRDRHLRELNEYKRAIIYHLYLHENNTAELPINDGAVRHLEQLDMIIKATSTRLVYMPDMIDTLGPKWPYVLQPWVASVLSKDSELKKSFESAYHVCT